MNIPVMLVLGYIALGLELGLRPALEFGRSGVSPSMILPLLVFVCLVAPGRQAMWVAVAFGAALDLTSPWPSADARRQLFLLGPNAIGFLAAAYLTVTVRGLVVRRNPLTLVVLSVIAMALSGLVVVSLMTLRGVYDPQLAIAPANELSRRTLSALYTVLTAGLMGIVLIPLAGPLGFAEKRR